jgi:hypothetical protein
MTRQLIEAMFVMVRGIFNYIMCNGSLLCWLGGMAPLRQKLKQTPLTYELTQGKMHSSPNFIL